MTKPKHPPIVVGEQRLSSPKYGQVLTAYEVSSTRVSYVSERGTRSWHGLTTWRKLELVSGPRPESDTTSFAKPLIAPTPERIAEARSRAALSQAQAAELVHLRHAVRWSEYERGVNGMPLATWELFLYKTGQRELALEDGDVTPSRPAVEPPADPPAWSAAG